MNQSNEVHRCKIQRVSAPMANDAVLSRLEEAILHSGCLSGVYNRLAGYHKDKIDRLQSSKKSLTQNLSKTKNEIEQVTESLTRVRHKASLEVLENKLSELLDLKKSIARRISEATNEIKALKKVIPEFSSDRELFDTFWKGWEKVNLATKRDLMRNVFEKIVVSERGLEVYFVVFKNEQSTNSS